MIVDPIATALVWLRANGLPPLFDETLTILPHVWPIRNAFAEFDDVPGRRTASKTVSHPVDARTGTCNAGVVNSPPLLNIVLYQPEIPQNTGNVGRTCLSVGGKLWLVRPLGFQMEEKRLRRAGLDYWQHLDVDIADNWQMLTEQLPPATHWYFTKTADRVYTDVRFKSGDTLVFGSETRGLPDSLLNDSSSRALRIPIQPLVRSLNLASAVSAAAMEVTRQWRESGLINDPGRPTLQDDPTTTPTPSP
jgi:tRNA (cytidine/uridine-2'-O-)-methyltransferase